MSKNISRRLFGRKTVSTGLAFGLAALDTQTSRAKIIGANDTIQLACVGLGNRGRQILNAFVKCDKVSFSAMADVDKRNLGSLRERYAPNSVGVDDFRKILDRNDVDAMILTTPDHWHAIMCVEACKAGKDVYTESPLSATISEGRVMIDAAKKYQRVVQVGLHRRSSPFYRNLNKEDFDKKIGKIACARTGYVSNMFSSGMGKAQPVPASKHFNWSFWLGPKPYRRFQENIAPYKFRWWKEYSSPMAVRGVHLLDLTRWLLREEAPVSVCAMGGKFAVDDDRTVPDTLETVFQFASGRILTFTCLESSGNPIFATDNKDQQLGSIELRGTNGTFYAHDNGFAIKPECGGQYQNRNPRMKEDSYWDETRDNDDNADLTRRHAQNFLDCVRTRKEPNCSLLEAHRSTVMSLMANISLEVGRRLNWDPKKEVFINDHEANKRLRYEYREPWKLEI